MTRTKKSAPKHRNKKDNGYRTDILNKSDMENERFTAYYKAQNIVPENEWESFMSALRQHLPTTFRVVGSRQIATSLNETIKNTHVPSLSEVVFEGQHVPPPVQIPWYPDGLAWQFNVPKKVLRKSEEFKKFHSFLVFETEVGNISRQEAVSMLPPLFLDVLPHHKVMDMCAAPGSKTAQLLEALHAQDSLTATAIPSGLLLANDSDNKRTHLLIHQSARLPSPALMVTNLDASIYPILKVPSAEGQLEQLRFDRILCDVPCSGDGTIRKNIGIWKTWQPMDGNGLHALQLRILQRAMKLLKSDGRIVYSTCSLNPVENEAVIADALKANTDFYLVDVSTRHPELKRRPGLTTWWPSVNRESTTSYETYQDFLNSPHAQSNTKLTEGHWPPKEFESLNLHRCLRIYPHLQDSGGFFIAVLERRLQGEYTSGVGTNIRERKREAGYPDEVPETKRLRLTDEHVKLEMEEMTHLPTIEAEVQIMDMELKAEKDPSAEESTPSISNKAGKIKKGKATEGVISFKEQPYTFLAPGDSILLNCIERLSLNSEFPSSNVLVRNPRGDAVRSLYLTNDLVKAVVENNEYTRIRLMAAGTKVFTKQDAAKGVEPQFRILGEGLPVVLTYVDPSTIITADLTSLKTLVQSYYPLCSSFTTPFRFIVEARPVGSHVVRFPPEKLDNGTMTNELVLPIWKSNVSLTLMMDKKAKSALSLRLFGADITTAGRDAAQQKKSAPAALDSTMSVSSRDEEANMNIENASIIVNS